MEAMEAGIERVLWSAADIDARVRELAAHLSADFVRRKPLLVVGVATGAFIFLADLVRHLKLPFEVDFVRVQSYGAATESSGAATIAADVKIGVHGKHVLLVEDIVDTGITLACLVAHFTAKGATSISVCSLLDKVSRRKVAVELPEGGFFYAGFQCPDSFVVGYGMDFAEHYRGLPYIAVLKPHVYEATLSEGGLIN